MDKHYIVKKSTVRWVLCIVALMMAVAVIVNYAWGSMQLMILRLASVFFTSLVVLLVVYWMFLHGKRN
jgi:hypothetical protein